MNGFTEAVEHHSLCAYMAAFDEANPFIPLVRCTCSIRRNPGYLAKEAERINRYKAELFEEFQDSRFQYWLRSFFDRFTYYSSRKFLRNAVFRIKREREKCHERSKRPGSDLGLQGVDALQCGAEGGDRSWAADGNCC